MDSRDNPLFWSIPCGNWFMTRVRVSLLVPLDPLCDAEFAASDCRW